MKNVPLKSTALNSSKPELKQEMFQNLFVATTLSIHRKMPVVILRTNSNARVAVDSLHQLLALMPDHPVGVNLGGALRVQRNHLESAEVCFTDRKVLWAHIINVQNIVLVEIVFADITTTITWEDNTDIYTWKLKRRGFSLQVKIWNICGPLREWLTIRVQLIRVKGQSAVVFVIRNAIIVIVVVAGVTLAILVVVCLVGVGDVGAVVQVVLVTILVNVLVIVALVSYAIWVRVNL